MGAIVYQCLTGQLPRTPEIEAAQSRCILETPVIPIRQLMPNIPTKIESVVMNALQVNHADRFQNAKEMQEALANAAIESEISF